MSNPLKAKLFERIADKYERCLWPFEECKQSPSHAHSIQNSRVIDMLHKNSHVIMPRQKMAIDTGPQVIFQSVGRHKASTFAGLCNIHDSYIFRPIDTLSIDIANPEHLFLIAYRSVFKEYHATLLSARSVQTLYSDAVQAGLIDPNGSDPAMDIATGRLIESYETYLYWMMFNKIYAESNFSLLKHSAMKLPSTRACIAVSSMFATVTNRQKTEAPPSLVLNIYPESDGSHTAIYSYLPQHSIWANDILSPLSAASGQHLLYMTSKLILKKCENFVLSPEVYDSFSEHKRNTMLEYFAGNISGAGRNLEMDSPELMLFQ